MTSHRVWGSLSVVTLLGTCLYAITPIIGVASALGTFVVNARAVEGNANLFDGSEVKTTKSTSEIYLKDGPTILLGVNSSGIFRRDLFALEQGASKVNGLHNYSVQLGPLRAQGESSDSRVMLRRKGDEVEIAALNGSIRLVNSSGVIMTHLRAGSVFQLNIAGQSVMVPDQSGVVSLVPKKEAPTLNEQMENYGALGVTVTGMGLATAALLQKPSTSP